MAKIEFVRLSWYLLRQNLLSILTIFRDYTVYVIFSMFEDQSKNQNTAGQVEGCNINPNLGEYIKLHGHTARGCIPDL